MHNPTECVHKCGKCNEGFINPSELKRHRRVHSEKRPFHCDKCSSRFKERAALTRHKNQHEDADAKIVYKCDICGHICTSDHNLKDHKSQKHNGVHCPCCGKVFDHRMKLGPHLNRCLKSLKSLKKGKK